MHFEQSEISASKNNKSISLAQILDPISVNEFIEKYFFKSPLHIKGSSNKFSLLPSREAIMPLIRHADNIRAVFADFQSAAISHRDAESMYGAGATICITGLDNAHAILEQLTESAKEELLYSGDISIRAYWSPENTGFDVHWDARVATTLQIEGSKRWWYTEQPAELMPRGNSPYPLSEEMMEQLENFNIKSVVLEPGDLLCLPPGVLHWAKGEGESFAYNLAFDYNGNTLADIISESIKSSLLNIPELRYPAYKASSYKESDISFENMSQDNDAYSFAKDILEKQSKSINDIMQSYFSKMKSQINNR